ncbi:MAG: ADP compounds hydrolase NudE [Chromatiaceae bacterium]|nr:ADP compounds hydrolase NudE [Chromatiaceae bacterium]
MAAKPKVLERRLVAETRIFRVEQVDLEFSNGNRRCFERVLGGRGSVLIVPMKDARTLLLVREYAAGTDRYELGFPKGIIEPGEDPLEAAGREVREEVGFGARDLRLIQGVSLAPGYIQHQTSLVLARDLYPDWAQGDEPEPIEVVPWPLDEMDSLLGRDDFTEARSIAALFLVKVFLDRERTDR